MPQNVSRLATQTTFQKDGIERKCFRVVKDSTFLGYDVSLGGRCPAFQDHRFFKISSKW
jgi:hypothetical protein